MTLLATFKHISSKNADYGAAEAYLTFEHDEFTMKATLDENGRLIPVSYTHLILDVVCSKGKIICIAGDVKSVNVVKGRFMKLNMEHIRYVMKCMQENTTTVSYTHLDVYKRQGWKHLFL